MDAILRDVRYALRTLRRNPVFTLVALVTIALGVGANTAIFSVVHAVLLRPLPFGQPDHLVQIWETRVERGWNRASPTEANFWDLQELNRTFEDIGAYRFGSANLTGFGFPQRLRTGFVTAGFFRILRVQPVLGRTFAPGEGEPGEENRLVLLSNELWRTQFGSDPAIVGQSLTLDGETFEVVGVLPAGEPWLNFSDIYAPLVRDPEPDRVNLELAVVGRLARGVSFEAGLADLESVARRLEEQYPEENAGMGINMAPASEWIASETLRRALWVLLGAVGFLLLIACVNLANLLIAKGTARQRESAVRTALGASNRRLARQMLTESLLLGLVGAGLGLLLAVWSIDLVRSFNPAGLPRLEHVGVNVSVLGFTIVVGVLAGMMSGLIPAFQAPRVNIVTALREGDRGVAGSRGQKRLRSALVAAEVALSLMLLVGAGLLIRSFIELQSVERGFRSENRLVAAVNVPASYDGQLTNDFLQRFLARVKAVPQVRSAAAVSTRPISGGNTSLAIVPAGQPEDLGESVPSATWRLVTGEYFRVMGIPLLKGRAFTERDLIDWEDPASTRPRVVISQSLSELLSPGEDPIGRMVILWQGQGDLAAEVVGVVGNMRERGLDTDPTRAVYIPYYGANWSPINIIVHTASDPPTAVVSTLRSILADLDPDLPLSNVQSMDEIVSGSVAERRFNMAMLAIFAGVALLLALAGIYGVQSYSVARRTSEIGVRVALGASRDNVMGLVIRQGIRPAAFGIVLGLLGAFLLSRLLSSLLFGIAPSDPGTYVGVTVLLGAAALLSCYLPARRALRIDPVTALREE
jgi:predicted permease